MTRGQSAGGYGRSGNSRGKSLEVIAELSGISRSSLSRIEHGERALDSRSEIVALANALQVAPSELTSFDVPAPSNGDNDVAVEAVCHSLTAVSRHRPGGQMLPTNALQIRVRDLLDAGRQCRQADVGAALPALIRDLHTSLRHWPGRGRAT